MIMAVPTLKNGKLNWCWRNQQGQWDVGYRDAGKILLVMFCLDIWFVFSHTQLGDAICLHWYGRITTWLIAHNSYFMLNFSPNSSDSRWRRSMKRGAYWSLPSVELHGIPLASYHDSRASLYQKELESTLPFYGCHFETCHCCRNVISNCVHSQGTQLRWVAVQTLMNWHENRTVLLQEANSVQGDVHTGRACSPCRSKTKIENQKRILQVIELMRHKKVVRNLFPRFFWQHERDRFLWRFATKFRFLIPYYFAARSFKLSLRYERITL